MKTKIINSRLYHLPENPDEVVHLVDQAKKTNQKIAVRGSAHSFPLVEKNEEHANYMFIMLSYLDKITSFDKSSGVVTVQAGCHLGLDPFDPTGVSTLEKSLCYQLDPYDPKLKKRTESPGWALPDLGGITHQTMGGFMATGSSGGTTFCSFEDSIISVDIVCYDSDGANIKTFKRPPRGVDDPFFGIAYANLGLMGIIISVTLQCIPSFNISGKETTSSYQKCEIDLFESGDQSKPSLETFLKKPIYSRLMWWPQKNVESMVVWQAERTDAFKDWENYKSKPYHEVPYIFGSPDLATLAADALYSFIGNWPNWLLKLFGNNPKTKEAIKAFVDKLNPILIKFMLKIFVKDGTVQEFHDIWWNGLPMDNQMSDKLFPVWFTELWIPIEKTQQVMNDLKAFYESDEENAGSFSCEIYATGKSDFWLLPSYNTDVVRIDIFWFGNNAGDPVDYYQKFWTALAKYDYRPHWGKYLPAPESAQGVEYLKKRYSTTWDKWQNLRKIMDPNDLFLTDYWAQHLGIEQ